ncbi:MAG: amidase domain-containing protein [Oscillospiraceae bacterium]|nr:amidase domain-containing protein [Oscillospiraceae bacterium]
MPMEYNRQMAVDYAHRWAFGRNPKYYNFDNLGGDCTNFASQCLFAGSGKMNYKKTFGWYYGNLNNRSPSWTGVVYLYNFLTANKGPGPFGHAARIEDAEEGDLVQLQFFSKDRFSHSPVIVKVHAPTPAGILIAAHSDDSDFRPLDTYPYKNYRVIHIDGVR